MRLPSLPPAGLNAEQKALYHTTWPVQSKRTSATSSLVGKMVR
jgi:hypothetical protein